MNATVLAALRCPNCALPLVEAGPTVRCPRAHSFDLAKQGHATLTAGRTPHPGATAEMVADRDTFLAAGHYRHIAEALAHTTQNAITGPPRAPAWDPTTVPPDDAGE